ncbi:hypothetical protein, partial [Kocuria rhizophila]|uniref:hypothetical protein n=1 Tax=Kocuria rhizophila TaxID=72000 RepID=UPI0016424784
MGKIVGGGKVMGKGKRGRVRMELCRMWTRWVRERGRRGGDGEDGGGEVVEVEGQDVVSEGEDVV